MQQILFFALRTFAATTHARIIQQAVKQASDSNGRNCNKNYWVELDEDLSFEGFFHEKKTNPLYNLFIAHPELNATAIARRLGMSQSLFAQYISGTKKPSKKRFDEIVETIRSIGRELSDISA